MQVNDRFKLDWGTYLTTSEQIIYGLIDGRGSGFKVRLGIRTPFCIITELAYGHKSEDRPRDLVTQQDKHLA